MERKNNRLSKVLLLLFLAASLNFVVHAQSKEKRVYDSSGKLLSKEFYDKKSLVKIVYYHPNGKVKKESHFGNSGELKGDQYEYYENGIRKSVITIVSTESVPESLIKEGGNADLRIDIVTSRIVTFYSNGKKKVSGYLIKGMRVGYWEFYDDNGQFKSSHFYNCLTPDE